MRSWEVGAAAGWWLPVVGCPSAMDRTTLRASARVAAEVLVRLAAVAAEMLVRLMAAAATARQRGDQCRNSVLPINAPAAK